MEPDPIFVLLHNYGWAAVIAYVAVKDFWPTIRDRVVPHYAAERKRRLEAELDERKTKAVEDAAYRKRLEELEQRQVAAFEKVGDAVQQMAVAMTLTNERLAQIMTNHLEHDRRMNEGFDRTRPVAAKSQ